MTKKEIINEIKCLLSELDNGEDAVSYLTQNDVKWLNENIKALEQEPQTFEWCKTCKEYNHEKHCCPRYNKVIRDTVEEMKQEPCEDTISRQGALDALHMCLGTNSYDDDVTGDSYICYEEAEYEIEKLPSVQPKQIECEDAISRDDALKLINDCGRCDDKSAYGTIYHGIEHLPSVQPQPKTGQWITVTERLPEDIKPVIITWKNIDPKSYYQYIVGKHFIGTAHYKNGKWFWYSSVTEDLLAEYGRCDSEEFDEAIEVIAWMPLPTPFEPQKSEDKE